MKNDGGTAFPTSGGYNFEGQSVVTTQPGMSLRDWFAGQALATLLIEANRSNPPEQVANWAYKLADAMIRERDSR